jgi:formylglycine-generating enzyme required for sulfatase activity
MKAFNTMKTNEFAWRSGNPHAGSCNTVTHLTKTTSHQSIFDTMKNLTLLFLTLFFVTGVFAQTTTDPHAKPAKQVNKPDPVDPKLAEMAREIESKMIKIDGGTFTMGCVIVQDSECYTQEKPRHTVTLNTFYMGKHAVTQKEWKALMGTTPAAKYCAECPVVNVSWFDAQLFINKLNQISNGGYRLPTEAEWEYAAKGGNSSHGYKYAGSNDVDEVAWYDTLKTHHIMEVAKKKANELGLYDMSGNVWQWCSDWFQEKYYSNSPSNNPQGPEKGTSRSLRGGSWWGPLRDCRVANRDMYPPDSKDDDVGFRLVRN